MISLRVIVSERAKAQIREHLLRIAEDSIDNALAWEDRLAAAVRGIGDVRGGYGIDGDASERYGEPIHKLAFERTFLIFYTLDRAKGLIKVVSFRHGARLPEVDEP